MFFRKNDPMGFKSTLITKRLITHITDVRILSNMDKLMSIQSILLGKGITTDVRTLSSM
jgi:hypothetical protein